jgi:murein DD-endopeptidase MepM/ murein hydrolase activator NlpD
VLVARGAAAAPRALTVALPAKIGPSAPKAESPAYFAGATLLSTDGGYMGKFPEGGQEADALAAQLAFNAAQMADSGAAAAQQAAGSDDDGGDLTPVDAEDIMLSDANSNSLDVTPGGANGAPQLKQTILRIVAPERISDLLIGNGYADESARDVEAAAKARYNVQTLPPHSLALVLGARDATGAYRVTQFAIYEDDDYVGSIALAENGLYGEGAQPTLPANFFVDSANAVDAAAHFDVADGIYSAGLRNGIPEPVIREAIQLIGRLTDLKASLPADEAMRLLYARNFRGKSKLIGKVIYIGLTGAAGGVDCYAFETQDGSFRCFDAKGSDAKGSDAKGSSALPGPIDSGATSVGGILAPIKGAPITSLFGMRFHPILHILRLHAGIDFGAPIGSQVRAAADGKIEIAGPVSGFGNHIRIKHDGFETSYSHLSEIPEAIKPGVEVKQGEIIALSGNTGLSTGPHLHFEFYLNGSAVDPLPHLGTEIHLAAGAGEGLVTGGAPASGGAAASGSAPASAEEIAAFPAAKALVDAALEAATK